MKIRKDKDMEKPRFRYNSLAKVIGAILRDIAKAQNFSNQYTKKIASIYQSDPGLRHFPVPNGQFRELEMELQYAVDDVLDKQDSTEELYLAAMEVFRAAASIAGPQIIDKLTKQVETALVDKTETGRYDQFVKAMHGSSFQGYLSARIFKDLVEHLPVLLKTDTGQLNDSQTDKIIENAVKEHLLGHPDVKKSLSELGIDIQADSLYMKDAKESATMIKSGLDAVRSLFDSPGLSVLTETSGLSNLPSEIVGKIRLRVELSNYKWVIELTKTGNGIDEEPHYILVEDK